MLQSERKIFEVKKMAKDGTNRGGVRVGAGRKKKSPDEKGLNEKLLINDNSLPIETSEELPPVKEYLGEKQKNGEKLCATEIYTEIWAWLKARGCEKLIDSHLLEQYAMCMARWQQCEQAISHLGLSGRHPTTGGMMASVYVKMSQDYLKLITQLRYQIYSAVKDNSTLDGLPYDGNDDMEKFFRERNKG